MKNILNKKKLKDKAKVFLDIFFNPTIFLYLTFIKFISKKIGFKVLSRNTIYLSNKKNCRNLSFLFESPALYKYPNGKPNLRYEAAPALFYRDLEGNHVFKNFTEFHCLDDRFTSYNSNLKINFENRSNKVLVVRTSQDYLWGHKERIILSKSTILSTNFEVLDLSINYVDDLKDYYIKHKFVVVIENDHNENYTSEKYYDVIKSGSIPVYHVSAKNNFIHCQIDKDKISSQEEILQKIQEFTKKYNEEEVAKRNFKILMKLRDHHVTEYLRYQALPYYAYSKKIHSKTLLYKLWKKFFK